jgi:hypothetical protein
VTCFLSTHHYLPSLVISSHSVSDKGIVNRAR